MKFFLPFQFFVFSYLRADVAILTAPRIAMFTIYQRGRIRLLF